MRTLKIKDNCFHRKDIFETLPFLTEKIANKTLKQLEREGVFVIPETISETEDVSHDQIILQSIDGGYHTGNVMGYFGYGDERLVIGSRFSNDDNDFFFQYLLDMVLDFPNVVDLDTDANHSNRIFNMLLFLFPSYLRKAMRKGLFKKYINRKYNDSNVKGVIDISRHITKNIPFVGKVAYNQREYSYDNYLTELIRHTIEYIHKKPYGKRLLSKVKDEVKLIKEASVEYELYDRQFVIEHNKRHLVSHAYYREYRDLQHLCILILRHQKQQIGSGDKKIYGILFDGAWLWEEYINMIIGDWFYHPRNKKGTEGQKLFSRNTGLIYPDFISRNCDNRIIADAKYKPIDNIRNKDFLQVLAYMFRFDACCGYYLYPEKNNYIENELWMNKGTTYEKNVEARDNISVIKLGLEIPEADTYEQFVESIKKNEKKLKNYIKVN